MKNYTRFALPLLFACLMLSACGGEKNPAPAKQEAAAAEESKGEASHAGEEEESEIALTDAQIRDAGIDLIPVRRGGGALSVPALIEGNPQGLQVVSAAIGGRVVSLTRNLGQSVARGQTLAIIESREATVLNAEIEASRARLGLAENNLRREQRLFSARVTAEQDLITARTAATEARIALRQAQQQLSAAGGGGGALNRVAIRAPLSGQVVARSVTLGQSVTADAELFRVANLDQVAVKLSLSPADAGKVRPGSVVDVVSGERRTQARVNFVSPMLDESTRLIDVIAVVGNQSGEWRIGEPVVASVQLGDSGNAALLIPSSSVQTVEGKPTVFVRTPKGFKATPITLGATNGDQVTVTGGLTGNEQIANANSFTLKAELGKGDAEHGH